MRKLTKLLQLMLIVLLSTTVVLAQKQVATSTAKNSPSKADVKKEIQIYNESAGNVEIQKEPLTEAEKEAFADYSGYNDSNVFFGSSPMKGTKAQVTVTLGTGTTYNSTSGHPCPYGTYYKNMRQQYLILGSELTALGLGAGFINAIAFNVQALNTVSAMPNYTIKMKATAQTALTATFEVGTYQTVWTAPTHTPVLGWNTYTFSPTGFYWNGTDNVLVDICHDLIATYTTNASVYYTATTGTNTALYYRSDATVACPYATGTVSVNRANMQITGEATVAPLITVNPNTLNFGYVAPASFFDLTYILAGTNLTPLNGTIAVTAPVGGNFLVSYAGLPFLPSYNIPYSGGTLPNTTVTVRFLPTSPNTLYTGTVTNGGGGGGSVGVAVSGNTYLYTKYCPSSATSTADEEIFNVTVGSLNNSSDCNTTAPGPGSVKNMYSNYTTTVAAPDLAASLSYPFSVQIGTCGGSYDNAIKIFIDYNQDGDFADPDEEEYVSLASTAGPHFETGDISVPAGATLGLTMMRVVNVETTLPGGILACGTYTWGETEDYLVNILAPTQPYLLAVPSTLNFGSWPSGSTSTELSYALSGANLNPPAGNITVTPPPNFEVSTTSGGPYSAAPISVLYAGGTVSQTIYVVFKPTAPNTVYTGNIVNAGGGASVNVAVSGSSPCDPLPLPYCEYFDLLTFPQCWSQGYAPAVTSDRWSVSATANAGGAVNEMHALWQNVIGESWLQSPVLIVPAGGAILTFKHLYDDYGAGLTLSVRYSNDNGAYWTTGYTIISGGGNIGPETVTVPITLSGNVIIQWYMNGNHYQLDNWWVDDVCLYVPYALDAKALSIDMPGLIQPGSINPMATVSNNGTQVISFTVTMTINPGGYTSTKQVLNLNPLTPIQVTFDPWNATVGNYLITVCTILPGDMDPGNDCIHLQPISVQELRKVYAYVAYDPTAGLPEGPAWFFVQTPGVITSLAATTSGQFIGAGTWADGVWYGSEYYDATLTPNGGGWWTIDPTTGVMTQIADIDKGFAGITFCKTTGVMYGTEWDAVALTNNLYTIDRFTGVATLLGSYGTSLMISLACDGTDLYGIGISDDYLYRIIPTSPPSAVQVGPTGQSFNYAQDMEYDHDNNIMYACGYTTTGTLYTVNLVTGACTAVGNFQGGSEMTGFAIPYTSIAQITGTIQNEAGIAPPETDLYIRAHRHCNPEDYIDNLGGGGIVYTVVGGVGTYTIDRNSFMDPPSAGDVVIVSVWNTVTGEFSTIEVVVTATPIITVNIIIRITIPVVLPTQTSFIVVVIPAHRTLKIHYTESDGCNNTDVYIWDGTRWVKYRDWNHNKYCMWRYIRNDSDQPMVYIIHNDSGTPIHFDLVYDIVFYATTPSNTNMFGVVGIGWMDRPNHSCELGSITAVDHTFTYNEGAFLTDFPSRLCASPGPGTEGCQNLTIQFETYANSFWGDMELMIDLVNVTQPGTLELNIPDAAIPVTTATINPGDILATFHTGGILTPGMHTMTLSAQGGLSMGIDAFLYTSIVPMFRVSGNVYYGTTGTSKPMATNTTVTLTPATPHGTVNTNSPAGDYEFASVVNGNYTLTGATTKAWGGLNSFDATLIKRYVGSVVSLTSLQKRAADVNQTNTITAFDATLILRRLSGPTGWTSWVNPYSFVWDGPWPSTPPLIGFPVTVAGSDVTVEFRTLATGDVNSSLTFP